MTMIADPSFNLKAQALAALHLLASRDKLELVPGHLVKSFTDHKHRIVVETYPVYNGRERSVCLMLSYAMDKKCRKLLLMFGENRNSDNLFLQASRLTKLAVYDQPTMSDFPEETWRTRRGFDYGRLDLLVDAVIADAQQFYNEVMTEE